MNAGASRTRFVDMKTEFRPRKIIVIGYAILGLALFLMSAFVIVGSVSSGLVCAAPLFVILALFSLWIALSPFAMKFVVREDDFEYHTLNYLVRASWSEVSFIQPDNDVMVLLLPINLNVQPKAWAKPIWLLISKERIQTIPIGLYSMIFGEEFGNTILHRLPKMKAEPIAPEINWR